MQYLLDIVIVRTDQQTSVQHCKTNLLFSSIVVIPGDTALHCMLIHLEQIKFSFSVRAGCFSE